MNKSLIKRMIAYSKYEVDIAEDDLPCILQYGYPDSSCNNSSLTDFRLKNSCKTCEPLQR